MTERRHKVLVADDDESVRESLRKLLHGEGYQVILAADGVEALETFRREKGRIDLLLVDLNMPLKNGWATVDRLLELDCSPPVLILTGLSHQSELAQAAGVSALVEKPVDVPALLELMRELLVKSASARLQNSGHHQLPFYHLRAADFPAAGPWANPHVAPYDHWGLNE